MFVLMLMSAGIAYGDELQGSEWRYFEDAGRIQQPLDALKLFSSSGAWSDVAALPPVITYQQPFNVGNVDKYYWFHHRLQRDRLQQVADGRLPYRLLAALPYRQLLNAYICSLIDCQSKI